jgi:hypothetical protein
MSDNLNRVSSKMTQITKIDYKCIATPEGNNLKGFIKGKIYKGRAFNGLYEITTEWASHQPTYLVEKKDFEKYFEVVQAKERQEA